MGGGILLQLIDSVGIGSFFKIIFFKKKVFLMSWRSRSCKWKGLTDYWNDIWIPSMMLYNDSLGKNRCLTNCHFQGNMKETSYKCWFFFSLWQIKYIHNAYSLSKNGIWNGLDLNSLKHYIKLNMVLGLKFLRLYIFFFTEMNTVHTVQKLYLWNHERCYMKQ